MPVPRTIALAMLLGCGSADPPPAIPDDDPPRDPVVDPAGRGWHCAPSNARCYRDPAECRTWDTTCSAQHVAFCLELPDGLDCYLAGADCEANRPDGAACFETP